VQETFESTAAGFPVVGIGASAGGLAAFEAFFSGMPADTDPGMAFVLVQHLAPDHESILTDLVRRYTRMQVFEVKDGMVVRPNCAYIIPPNRDMAFLNGTLQLMEPAAPRGQRLPIDFFFRSLAQDQHERAICIVLSGTGSDGTQGVRAIKGEGGMAMAQNPDSTEYDGMPRSAIATGLVDYELPPAEMPAQLIAYVSHAFGKSPRPTAAPAPKAENALKKIFILLRAQTGHDFSQYKQSTIHRRIERRMAVHQIEAMDKYVKCLQQAPAEVEALFRDLLIGVTSFFRDPEAFKGLEEQVIPKLFAGKPADAAIRVWAPGCSTGEEAYSLAILLQERLEVLKQGFKVQVFATDIDSQAIATARAGLYPASVAADISSERMARFFAAEPDGSAYRIHKGIRDLIVFSEQDVIKDPPFSKLDLISCRNLLIYMGGDLQKKLIPLFHYALKPGAFLFLGTSETVGEFGDLFSTLDRKLKLYQRKEGIHGAQRAALGRFLLPMTAQGEAVPRAALLRKGYGGQAGETADTGKQSLRELTEQALLQQVAPAGALVNGQGDILYLYGRTGLYLEPAQGEAGINNILKMAREGLRRELTTALHQAASEKRVVRYPGLHVKTNGDFTTVNLTVRPVAAGPVETPESPLYLVILEEAPPSAPGSRDQPSVSSDQPSDADARIVALKQELRAKEEYLQTANEQLETSNEELKSSNEEMQSVNEELQSTNEELETSKEELQSVNEELATVNAELQTKVGDLSRANNDMNNLLAGTGIGTIFVDHQLRILRFTPAVTQIINLILSDVGRPVGHIVSNLIGYNRLVADVQGVLDSLISKEVEVKTQTGAWYTLRIQPYRTLDNVIEGAVITFVNTTEAKKARDEQQLNEARVRVALQAYPIVVSSQDKELRYTWIHDPNPKFSAERVLGKTDADLLSADEAANLTAIKRRVLESGKGTRREVRATIDGKPHFYDLTVEPLRDAAGEIIGITCAMLEISGRRPQGRAAAFEPQGSAEAPHEGFGAAPPQGPLSAFFGAPVPHGCLAVPHGVLGGGFGLHESAMMFFPLTGGSPTGGTAATPSTSTPSRPGLANRPDGPRSIMPTRTPACKPSPAGGEPQNP
jgi:two-component system CheB/CheR fusion protein